jgi:hypothetical protein
MTTCRASEVSPSGRVVGGAAEVVVTVEPEPLPSSVVVGAIVVVDDDAAMEVVDEVG